MPNVVQVLLCVLSCVPAFATPWAVGCQAPLSMGFPRQEHWNGLPCPPPGVFLTEILNSGLLHCRQNLYQLTYEESPLIRA